MLSRRKFLNAAAAGATGLLMPWDRAAAAQIDGRQLAKYVDALPIPGVLSPTIPGGSHYQVEMSQFKQQLHRDLRNKTFVWGYNGSYPGPTFEARRYKPITVQWVNKLPPHHLLPLDTTIEDSPVDFPPNRVSPHLHGGHILSMFDGEPTAWFSTGPHPRTGPDFYGTKYEYANDQQAATLWYHDHADGITRLNVYAGLAGFYLIRDDVEDSLNLPSGRFEIPLVIQDRSFDQHGQLFYPDTGDKCHPIWVPIAYHDTAVVNGKVWPFLEVEPRKYRFRILNGSNARFYNLSLTSGQSFTQIGSDGGFLPAPVTLEELLLAPAERADVILDFAKYKGQTIVLTNDAPAVLPDGTSVPLPEIMQFRVTLPLSKPDTSSLPAKLPPFHRLDPQSAVKVRYLTLNHHKACDGQFGTQLRMGPNVGGLPFTAGVTEFVQSHTTEIWTFLNLTDGAHPIHLHLVQFQVLSRQDFDAKTYIATNGATLNLIGSPVPPDPNEMGPKDTVRANPGPDANTGQLTRIIAQFDPLFYDTVRKFVWHCHILEHEDNSMMRPYKVV
jgi:spore coat protein A